MIQSIIVNLYLNKAQIIYIYNSSLYDDGDDCCHQNMLE